jgi:regulatory protein
VLICVNLWIKLFLVFGEEMDVQALEAARAVAFRFLGFAARSRVEIERRLERGGFDSATIATVIAELEAQGYLDDAKFAQDWVEDRAERKKYGRGRLTAELRRKGVEKELVTEAIDSVGDEEEYTRALAAARPKWSVERTIGLDSKAILAEKRKLANFLQRRGFSWSIITKVLEELMVKEE